ncbi:MAG: citrate/2-methylcitrate synthase [Planctomycetota bacterium]|jgi:succinyl-CoA synthetase alpha subunit/citrate synthase
MRATNLSDLLKANDRIAVSNITGREASKVTAVSQKYCGNIVGGWALGKGGQTIDIVGMDPVPVFSTVQELSERLGKKKQPNKVIVYSPPAAVYAEVKEIVEHLRETVETLYIITENVSIEVTAKIAQMCSQANIDVLGCNSLGVINVHDKVRAGAVGGNDPGESFRPGSTAIISNSGNMVNTMASYLLSAGMGTSYGISTGKDQLILFPIKNLLELAHRDEATKLIVAYVEPGGLYEKEAIEMLRQVENPKPIVVYITGDILAQGELALGHAGAVVEGAGTSAEDKMKLFDEYFGIEPFDRNARYKKSPALAEKLKRGIRITTLHHLPAAAALLCGTLGIERDFKPSKPLKPNPWFADYDHNGLAKQLPRKLILHRGTIPKAYATQVKLLTRETIGANPPRRSMRNASHASSNDGRQTRIYGESLEKEMQKGSFVESLLFYWLGRRPRDFEAKAVEKCLIGALTNGPGTISAQGAKLSTSAGNAPNTAMIATLACLGDVHGGNGRRAVEYLCRIFANVDIRDPWDPDHGVDVEGIVKSEVTHFGKIRAAAKEAGTDYKRIPCLGHPVFKDNPVNYDPREQAVTEYLEQEGFCNIFLQFYHLLALGLKEIGIARNVWAVNLDGAIASVVLGLCWKPLKEKQITLQRVCDIAFMVFALGRVAGAAGEFLDHQDYGTPMDMRIPVDEITVLGR